MKTNREGKVPVRIRSFGRRKDMKKNKMTYLRYLLTGAMILSIIAGSLVTGCKKEEETYYTAKGVMIEADEDGHVSEYPGTSQTEETGPTGISDGTEETCLFYEGKKYQYSYSGFYPKLPEGFEKIGTIEEVDKTELIEKDFCATGPDMKVGMAVYAAEKYPGHLYVEYVTGDVVSYMAFYTLG